ncbi:MmcQ/YjbR family DNA-binding protein [Streptomyces sp. NPDC051569]|uniref:MmcQ/YjbR family DNA-binding protein n=1 Tax=Streptomyces sp. NPDC051569 TaxID=3365661 RepID=UPI0037BB4699
MATKPTGARTTWEEVREFALSLPGAAEEFPWGEPVVKVNKKIFVFLGMGHGTDPLGVGFKLTDEAAHAHALSLPGAEPVGYGLGKAGWVRVPLEEKGAQPARLLCDWVEESYRVIATKKLIAELDGIGSATKS